MTSRTLFPHGRLRPPGPPVLATGPRPVAAVAVLAVLVLAVVVLTIRHDTAADAVAVLDLVLSGTAVVGTAVVLVTTYSVARTTRDQMLHDLDAARRTEAVADDLRDEVLRLQFELARLAARVETSQRVK